MIINGINTEYRSDLLVNKVVDLIKKGISTEKILILTLNSFKKEKISSKIQEILFENKISGYAQINISTFAGLAYNSINKNWINIEKILKDTNREISPILCGLDASQYFFKNIIKEENFNDYFSKKNLMHQLLRRYKLIVENSLTPSELAEKSNILSESFSQNATDAINSYKVVSAKNRFFDNIKQTASFLYLLKSKLLDDFKNIEYFFADDVDEYNYSAFEFCKYIIEQSKEHFLYLDSAGCSRKGYLCGYSAIYNDLKSQLNESEIVLRNNSLLHNDANNLYKNLANNEKNNLDNFEQFSYSKRLEMLEAVSNKIVELCKHGTPVNKIQIITPLADENLFYSLKEFMRKQNIKIQLLTGSKQISEDIYVYSIITILELINPNWGIIPNAFEIRFLLNEILQTPTYECKKFVEFYLKNNTLPDDTDLPGYEILYNLISDTELKNKSLQHQFERIFTEIIAPNMSNECDFEPVNLLLKSINEFEKIKNNFEKFDGIILTPKDWLLHIKNSIVSQNPSKPAHIDENALVVSTAQKIIDFGLQSDYQFWLDTSSSEWIKEDIGTIYNAWVFQKNFNQREYNPELNKSLTYEKTGCVLRKLALCASKKIFAYSSVFDISGRENYGDLNGYIKTNDIEKVKFNFIPRDDQKEILNYKSGKLAVPAVPGAGKTTVMLALLFELANRGVNPQNILVLTYMESAARNFLNRYKKITSEPSKLPRISTIHALAYKILMENNNYAFVNLPEDFSICDDALKTSIIKEICSFNLPLGENLDDYTNLMISAISKVKISNLKLKKIKIESEFDIQINEFYNIYKIYSDRQKELSLLDYDDLLFYAVKLLQENENVREFYQEKYHYIIEDEAQDSSSIQQELISLLSQKYNNVIRCGDVNQAILGTFSNSDVAGFKQFISENPKVEMFRSQRCAKNIYALANKLIDSAKNSSATKDAFYDLKMKEVEGKNPNINLKNEYISFENPIDEKEHILSDIKEKFADKNKLPSVAILLRTNKQVASWSSFIENHGLNVICRGDGYRQKKVFTFILSAMEMFYAPWNNKFVANFYKEYCSIKKITFDNNLYKYISNSQDIVLNPQFVQQKNCINSEFESIWWEAFSIVENHTLDIQEIVLYCANNYFDDMTDRSNAFLFSVLITRYCNALNSDDKFQLNYIPEVLKYFRNLLSQKTLKGITMFSKEDEDSDFRGYIQIMTLHKAKGAEFDYVYLPEFTDFNYSLNFAKCCERVNKTKKPLLQKLDKLITGKNKSVTSIATEEINETLRLIYVAITRAKSGLKFTYSKKNDFKRDNNPVAIMEELLRQGQLNR